MIVIICVSRPSIDMANIIYDNINPIFTTQNMFINDDVNLIK